MAHWPQHSGDDRHARLFELIRQENVVNQFADDPNPAKPLKLRDMQHFLKQAHRSLIAEKDRSKDFNSRL